MSTQRRVVRWQRPYMTELAGTGDPLSLDGGVSGSRVSFRGAIAVRTAWLSGSSSHWTCGQLDWATNSLSFSSCCSWVQRNSLGCLQQHDRFFSGIADDAGWNSIPTASPQAFLAFSPPIRRFRADTSVSRPTHAFGLAAVPTGLSRGTERQHGQGNLYFEHAA
jgi:hypothetical protein